MSGGGPLGGPPLGSGPMVSWLTTREQLPGVGTDQLGEFERSLVQQNIKAVGGPDEGTHTFYDPRNQRSGQKGPNA